MNTEPPIGDDLQRMLVTMKQVVIKRAEETRPRLVRRRHVGPVIGLVALLTIGTATGAYALGLVPHDLFAGPVTSPSPTSSPTPTAPTSTPATATPTAQPAPTPTATPTPGKVFARDDPGTWTVSFTEVGPVALGAPYDGEIDDLTSAYTRNPNENCPNPNVSFWYRDGSVPIVVTEKDGLVSGVSVGLLGSSDPSNLATSPTTAEGAGIGSTLDELKAMYPGIQKTGTYGGNDPSGTFDYWSVQEAGHAITFQLDDDGSHVGEVWVGSDPQPPSEFCG